MNSSNANGLRQSNSPTSLHSSSSPRRKRHRLQRRNKSRASTSASKVAGDRLVNTPKASEVSSVPLLEYWKSNGGSEADLPMSQQSKDGSSRSSASECGSARRIGAGLWHFQLDAAAVVAGEGIGSGAGGGTARSVLLNGPCNLHAKTKYLHSHRHCNEDHDKERRNSSLSWLRKYSPCKVKHSLKPHSSTIEGATKWDPARLSIVPYDIYPRSTHTSSPVNESFATISAASALQAEVLKARDRIHELEAKRRSSKKKLHHFLTEVGMENALWQKKERRKMYAFVDDLKDALSEEKRYCQTMEVVNSRLNKELLKAKSSAKECMKVYEEERKSKEVMEEVCNELAKEIGGNKADIEALRKQSAKMREDLEAEKKMLQLAEALREERVQMKLTEAKLILEEKFQRLKELADNVETVMKSRRNAPEVIECNEAELNRQIVNSPRKPDVVKEITHLSRKLVDLFSNTEDTSDNEAEEKDIKSYSGPFDGTRDSESLSCVQDPGFNNSPQVSVTSRRRQPPVIGVRCEDDEARNSCESGISTELCSSSSPRQSKEKMPLRPPLVMSSRPNNFEEPAGPATESVDRYLDSLLMHWSPSDSENPRIAALGKTGCIEWPRSVQRSRLKARLLEAQVESEKSELCRVLQQLN